MNQNEFTCIKKKLTILLEALDAAMPFCTSVGIEVTKEKSYDEWENIVQQYFDSFVLSVIENEVGTHTINSFKKLGSVIGDEYFKNVICAEYDGKTYFINDIVSYDGLSNNIEWLNYKTNDEPDAGKEKTFNSVEMLGNFSISKI